MKKKNSISLLVILFLFNYNTFGNTMKDLPYHHLPDGTFRNPEGSPQRDPNFNWSFKIFNEEKKKLNINVPPGHVINKKEVLENLKKYKNKDYVAWIGHATFLIKLGNTTIITDPVFEKNMGPLIFGPKRYVDPAINLKEIPEVNLFLLTHNHYDHLHNDSLNRFSENTRLYLPLDNAEHVDFDQGPIIEMDWYTQTKHDDTSIHFLPANHTSSRGISDHEESLWGSWLLQDGSYSVYFAGDTGYSPIFKDMHSKFGDIDVCLMPIVAYPGPARKMHLAPEDAIKAAQDLGCKIFVPWGYGTWSLGYEHVNEPLRRLAKAVEDMKPNFIVKPLKMGESLNYVELLKLKRIVLN